MKHRVPSVERFVNSILTDRRPRRFAADENDAALMRAAAALHAAKPGADLPRAEFIDALAARLRKQAVAGDPADRPIASRRGFLVGAGAAAAGLAAGVFAGEHLFVANGNSTVTSAEMVPDTGSWVSVAALADLSAGQAVQFSAGSIEGFLVNEGPNLRALSAVCTHLGCLLRFQRADAHLVCPCHGAAFALDGSIVPNGYPGYLRPLPRLRSRVVGGDVQVFVI